MPLIDADGDNVTNLDVERAVLAAVMSLEGIDSLKAWGVVLTEIRTPLAFAERDHVFCATAINGLWDLGKSCDAYGVATALTQVRFHDAVSALSEARTGKKMQFTLSDGIGYDDSVLCAIGGYNKIADMAAAFCGQRTNDVIRRNALVIAEHYRQRLTIARFEKVLMDLRSPAGRINLRPVVENALEDVIRLLGSRAGTRSMDEAVERAVEHHRAMAQDTKKSVPVWPLGQLDRACRMRLGSLVTLAATNGGGKTSFALQTATATAKTLAEDGCVGIVSREMASEDLARIIACREAELDSSAADRGELTADEVERMKAAIDEIGGKRIVMCDTMEKLTHKEVCAWARQQHMKTSGAMKLLIVDHLGCLDPEHPRHTDYEKVTNATRAFKVLANDLRIVVLVLCQINRAGQRKSEGGHKGFAASFGAEDFSLADLKGSGSIGDDSDQVVFICRQYEADMEQLPVKIKVGKNRWGGKPVLDAIFDKANGQKFVLKIDRPDEDRDGMPGVTYAGRVGGNNASHLIAGDTTRAAKMDSKPSDKENLFGA